MGESGRRFARVIGGTFAGAALTLLGIGLLSEGFAWDRVTKTRPVPIRDLDRLAGGKQWARVEAKGIARPGFAAPGDPEAVLQRLLIFKCRGGKSGDVTLYDRTVPEELRVTDGAGEALVAVRGMEEKLLRETACGPMTGTRLPDGIARALQK